MARCGDHPRRSWCRHRPDVAPAADLVRHQFSALPPSMVWVAALAEFSTGAGPLHDAAA